MIPIESGRHVGVDVMCFRDRTAYVVAEALAEHAVNFRLCEDNLLIKVYVRRYHDALDKAGTRGNVCISCLNPKGGVLVQKRSN